MGVVLPSRVTVIQVLLIYIAILTNAAGIVHVIVVLWFSKVYGYYTTAKGTTHTP